MRLVGLTGGIGSGKSTVAHLFEDHGAVVIDADAIARDVLEPGTAGFDEVVARFGPAVVGDDGGLDRARLADIVFGDEQARADLNAIVHPRVREEMGRRLDRLAVNSETDMVILDIPLLAESGEVDAYDAVVVVTAPEEVRVGRLVRERGMDPDDVRARIATQADDEDRRAIATHVIDNSGTREELVEQVDRIHEELMAART